MDTLVLDHHVVPAESTNQSAPTPTPRRRRTGLGVAIAGAVCLVLGLVGAGALFTAGVVQIARIADGFNSMQRVDAPGSETVSIGRGKRYIWITSDKEYAVAKPELTITVTNLRTEEQIPVIVAKQGDFNSDSAQEWLYGTVTIPTDADYIVNASGGRQPFMVGFTDMDKERELIGVALMVGAIFFGSILIIVGAVFLPVGLVQMYRSRRPRPI